MLETVISKEKAMRPLRFRGMDVNGNWHYGNLAVLDKRIPSCADAGCYISNSAGLPFAYSVRPETVGQFTGLHDSQGVEIWEGDIIEAFDFYLGDSFIKADRGVVEFVDGCFGVKANGRDRRGKPTGELWEALDSCAIANYSIRSIGNIHQNPDLLKEGEDE